jgi:hypothetical protein
MVPHLPNEIIYKITEGLLPRDLRLYREVSKNWCRLITPIAFQVIHLRSTLKGASGLFEILQSEQLRGYVRELVLVVHIDSTVFKGTCRQAKSV